MDPSPPTPSLRVIGAGLGRTGTNSLKVALEQLGFGPCHHMEEVFKNPGQIPTWEAAANGKKIDWATFLRGWGSVVDFPAAFYYRELMEVFPDAKVLLSVRDPEGWYDSFNSTIHAMVKPVDLGLALSPDGRYLLFAQNDLSGSDLMLVENFR